MEENFASIVYALVRQIPKGKVATYGQIALLVGKPRAARVIGGLMSRCPESEKVPCHRVVKHKGALCEGFTFGHLQNELLHIEGVAFLPDGRVDLHTSCWEGPPAKDHV